MNVTEHNQQEARRMISSLPSFSDTVIRLKEADIDNRDAVFLFDLLYVLEEISKIGKTTHNDKLPHPAYIEEKLSRAKRILDNCYSYFLSRKEQEIKKGEKKNV